MVCLCKILAASLSVVTAVSALPVQRGDSTAVMLRADKADSVKASSGVSLAGLKAAEQVAAQLLGSRSEDIDARLSYRALLEERKHSKSKGKAKGNSNVPFDIAGGGGGSVSTQSGGSNIGNKPVFGTIPEFIKSA
ncbi:hypothetical protein FA95DRAFT_1607742 [Auriscalpium vulgare]|uniref:Uncharacterized protein n=1 Tax=Auriscalpium vulgare TaxID=40419 RepID=A0ACB8RNJ3_9AGAM|nr:hypothetical protein FA95DRAFT_1607742 [Auriscalpium vulgare]